MTKRVLDVGNCPPDHVAIRELIQGHFDALVIQVHSAKDTLTRLQQQDIDLVLVNRKLDRDYSDGLEVIRQIKSSPELAHIPAMLITNYEEHQQHALRAGALRGFGKLELEAASTLERLRQVLEPAREPV